MNIPKTEIGFDEKLTEISMKSKHSYSSIKSIYEQIQNYEDIEKVLDNILIYENERIAIGVYFLNKVRKDELDSNDFRVNNWLNCVSIKDCGIHDRNKDKLRLSS